MAIDATIPTVLNATYDQWAFTFQTMGTGLVSYGVAATANPPVLALASLTKFRVRPDGLSEASPIPSDTISIAVPDIYAMAAETTAEGQAVATALNALVAAVQAVAQAQGKL